MFRYVALSWKADDPLAAQTARRLAARMQMAGSAWQVVLDRPGLNVFTVGTRQGINGAYPLLPNQGVILGKLFRRSDLDAAPTPDVSLSVNEVDRIVQSRGRALIDRFWGRYVALVCVDSGELVVLRDPTGGLPCFLMQHRGVRLIFSWLDDARGLIPDLPTPSVNWDYLAVHIASQALECRETAIDGVAQVIAGEAVLLRGENMTFETYWSPFAIARSARGDNRTEAAVALRRTVRHCVQAWAQCYGNVMLRLSGGIDSSIVATCLSVGSASARVTCITHYSAGSDTDERGYARLAAARAQRRLIEVERDPGMRLERILDVAGTPNPSFYLQRLDIEHLEAGPVAASGAAAVFSGGGGDQLFFEIPIAWGAADYLRLRGMDAGFGAAAMDAARLSGSSVWKVLGMALLDRVHLVRHDLRADIAPSELALINPDVVAAARRDRRFMHPALLSVEDTPPAKFRQVGLLLYPDEYYDPLRKMSAPESLCPLMSQPVVELCLQLPIHVLTNGGRGRALARQAFAADLPPEIARRRSKGGLLEHVHAVLQRNRKFVRAMLLDGALVRHKIADPSRLDEVLSDRPRAIASPVTELYLFLGIEAWLNRWSSARSRAAA